MRSGALKSRFLKAWYGLLGLLLLEVFAYLGTGFIASLCQKNQWEAFTSSMRVWQAVDNVPFAGYINQYAHRYGISPELVAAVIEAESSFQPKALSRAGAYGLMQVIPGTWNQMNKELSICVGRHEGACTKECYYDPELNIHMGTAYLSKLVNQYNSNIIYALAAYNSGPGSVDRYGGVPPFPETQEYVSRIVENWQKKHSGEKEIKLASFRAWVFIHKTTGWILISTVLLTVILGYNLFRMYRSWRWR
jgi:hypothetical protein